MLGSRAMLLCVLFASAKCYSSSFVGAGFAARSAGLKSLSRFPPLRGGHADWPSKLHVTASGQASEPISKEAAQQ